LQHAALLFIYCNYKFLSKLQSHFSTRAQRTAHAFDGKGTTGTLPLFRLRGPFVICFASPLRATQKKADEYIDYTTLIRGDEWEGMTSKIIRVLSVNGV
jgi:hypothetical protein